MSTTSSSYRGFRLPVEVINHEVWLYHCFSLSLRDIALILAARGIVVSYKAIHEWSLRFGLTYARTLMRRRTKPGDKWFLDEVFVRIPGKLHYLWLMLGSSLSLLKVGAFWRAALVSIIRLGCGAAIGIAVAVLFGLSGSMKAVLILPCANPVAVYNYLFAQRWNNQPEEVAGVVVLSTLFSIVTIPLLLG